MGKALAAAVAVVVVVVAGLAAYYAVHHRALTGLLPSTTTTATGLGPGAGRGHGPGGAATAPRVNATQGAIVTSSVSTSVPPGGMGAMGLGVAAWGLVATLLAVRL